ncbi:MAG TPA: hypothetical protein VM736_14405 [Gemmatimonadales bacterium]|nr:hypothetical protein [Gemmatimonadales bacterium]
MELIVVVAMLGLGVGVTGLAFGSLRLPRTSVAIVALQRARARAIVSGRPVPTEPPAGAPQRSSRRVATLFLPDGRAVGPDADPLTGAPIDAPR